MYLVIAIIVIFFSGYLFKKNAGTMSVFKLNMMSWIYYYDFILLSFIGAILVVYSIDNHYLIDKLMMHSSRMKGFWAIMYTLLTFPLGMKLSNLCFGIKRMDLLFTKYTTDPLQNDGKSKEESHRIKIILIFLSIICFISILYVLYELGDIPLFKMLRGDTDASELAIFRGNASRHFAGNEYIKNILALLLTPILSYVAYGYKQLNNNIHNKIWFYGMFLCSILILTYNLAKAPVIFYLLGFMFYKIYTKGKISKKLFITIGASILALLVIFYVVIMQNVDIDLLFGYNSGIVGRLILSQSAGTYLTFDLFPGTYDHIGFSSISQFLSDIFALDYSERSARLIMEYVNPRGVDLGTAGVMNSLFIAEAWANWGIIGLLVTPISVGFLIQSLYIFFLRSPKTPLFVALFVSFSIKGSINGGVNDYIYNINFIALFILVLFIYNGHLYIKRIKNIT